MELDRTGDEDRSETQVRRAFEWSAYGRPCLGERVSGDIAIAVAMEHQLLVALFDVLGHGTEANALAEEMAAYVKAHAVAEPVAMIRKLHTTFRGSRGAVGGCAALDVYSDNVSFAGVGNPYFRVLSPSRSVTLPVSAGIIGGRMRSPTVQRVHMQAGELLLGCSDGVTEGFSVADYPQMFSHGVWAVARSVVQRFGKDYDDSTCLVVRRLGK